MCRWLAYFSPHEPCLLSDVLITPDHALTKQVNSHYLPYLIPHQLVPIDEIDEVDPPNRLAPPIVNPDKHSRDLQLRNLMLNDDGCGIAWYTPTHNSFVHPLSGYSTSGSSTTSSSSTDHDDNSPRQSSSLEPAFYKSIQPLNNDMNFKSIASNTSTKCLLAHVRASSAAPVSTVNCHPFVFGKLCVMHNGSVSHFAQIKRRLLENVSLEVYSAIQGGTDSETLAALIVDCINNLTKQDGKSSREIKVEDMYIAVVNVFKHIIQVQKEVVGEEKMLPSSLNVCVTNGQQLVATRFRNATDEEPPSLYWSDRAGVTLNQKFPGYANGLGKEKTTKRETRPAEEHGRHIIIASEPSTFIEEDWHLIEKNSAVLVDCKSANAFKSICQMSSHGISWSDN